MNSRERILGILAGAPVDRLPCDLWATEETVAKLLAHTGAGTEERLYEQLGIDKIIWLKAPYRAAQSPAEEGAGADEWGVRFRDVGYGEGSYRECALAPLAGLETLAEYEAHPWPRVESFDYGVLARKAPEAAAGRATMLSFISLFEIYSAMRTLEGALMDLYVEKDLAHYALERICGIQLNYMDRAMAAAGEHLDLVYFSDDMGMQDRQLFGTDVWDEFIAPRAERIIDRAHAHGKKVFYHTDGSAPEIVDRLVAMGIDVLNPIQHLCPGMERERLKGLYGGKAVFHGAVENQRVLPFGSPADVARETEECMRILGAGGGYIVAPCHNIQPNTPVENILALYETVREAGSRYL